MIGAGLSLDQAPPISVPFRFFLAAPLFGLLAGVLLIILPPVVFFSRWSAGALTLTHLMILGFIVTTLMGALFQILPVVAGATIKRVHILSAWLLPLHLVGTLGLCYGFLTSNWKSALIPISFLVIGVLIFTTAVFQSLIQTRNKSESVTGIRLSIISFFLTLLLGLFLLMGELGVPLPFFRPELTDIHLSQGLIGTIFLLIVSVSYQVIPMFYVTSSYPKWLRSWLAPFTFTLVIFNFAVTAASVTHRIPVLLLSRYLLALPIAIFSITTFRLFTQRRRKTFDGSLWFWKTSLAFALTAILFWFLKLDLWMGAFAIQAILAAIFGMLTKIIPFLIWFHLQTAARSLAPAPKVPHMKAILPDRHTQITYALFVVSAGFFSLNLINANVFQVWAGISICALFAFFFGIVTRSIWIYRKSLSTMPPHA